MSTLSLPHTRRYGFDCVFLDFFASSGFSTRMKTKQISNDIFFTTNSLFSLFFLGKKHKSRKQNNTLTSEKNSLTEEIERALENLQSSDKKNPKKLYKEMRTLPIFFALFSPFLGETLGPL
jgi:hypothetical protein